MGLLAMEEDSDYLARWSPTFCASLFLCANFILLLSSSAVFASTPTCVCRAWSKLFVHLVCPPRLPVWLACCATDGVGARGRSWHCRCQPRSRQLLAAAAAVWICGSGVCSCACAHACAWLHIVQWHPCVVGYMYMRILDSVHIFWCTNMTNMHTH